MKLDEQNKLPVYLALGFSILMMGVSAPMNKIIMAGGMPAAVINFWRLSTAALCTLPFVVFSARGRLELRQLVSSRKDMLLLAASGVFLALHFYVWVQSLKFTSTFGSMVLVCAHPVFTLIGDRFLFGVRYSRRSLMGVSVCFLGILLVGANSLLRQEGNITGDLLALLGALLFSGYMLVGREMRSRYTVNTYTTGVYGISAVLLAVFILLSGWSFAPYEPKLFFDVGVIVVCSTFFGHTIVNWSLGHIPTSTASIMMLVQPLITGTWAFFLLGDRPSIFLLMGGLVTMAGMLWYMLEQTRQSRRRAMESGIDDTQEMMPKE